MVDVHVYMADVHTCKDGDVRVCKHGRCTSKHSIYIDMIENMANV